MYHGAEQWRNRTAPGVHEAFSQIWGTERLWCSHDRVNVKPPLLPDADERAQAAATGRFVGGLHWDTATLYAYVNTINHVPARQPSALATNAAEGVGEIEFGVQGVLYLVDTPAEQGAFCAVPGFHRKITPWLSTLAANADPKQEDLVALGPVRIPGRAGDLVIWQTSLPHTSSHNLGVAPRVVQYITMSPAGGPQDEEARWAPTYLARPLTSVTHQSR